MVEEKNLISNEKLPFIVKNEKEIGKLSESKEEEEEFLKPTRKVDLNFLDGRLNFNRKITLNKKVNLNYLDSFFTILIVAPLVVCFWRGTWTLLELHPQIFPLWESCIFAFIAAISLLIVKDVLYELTKNSKKNETKAIFSKILRRIFIYSFSWVCIMQWRGLWNIFDMIFGIELTEDGKVKADTDFLLPSLVTGCAAFILILLRTFRNVLAPPFVIILDNSEICFSIPTRFKLKVSFQTSIFFINC